MERPLAGYRIIELGQIDNGPYCTLLRALLGHTQADLDCWRAQGVI